MASGKSICIESAELEIIKKKSYNSIKPVFNKSTVAVTRTCLLPLGVESFQLFAYLGCVSLFTFYEKPIQFYL